MSHSTASRLSNRPQTPAGFTLIELLVTLLIFGIVLAIAVPRVDVDSAQALHHARAFTASLNFARTEAVQRYSSVVICASNDPEAESPSCANDWASGWIIFADSDGDGALGAQAVLRRQAAPSGSVRVVASSGATAVSFGKLGFADQASDFLFCSPGAGNNGRTVSVTASGRALRLKGNSECT